MAEVLLRHRLETLGIDATVRSAGRWYACGQPSLGAVAAMATRGLDLNAHRSRLTTPDLLAGADLVLTMERAHVREAVATNPAAWPKTFTLKELVRRATAVGPRHPEQPLDDWLASLHV